MFRTIPEYVSIRIKFSTFVAILCLVSAAFCWVAMSLAALR